MKRSLFLLALETSAKAIRTGFATVGALTDCGMRGPVVRDSLWLTKFEEENEVFEAPLSADFDDEPLESCAACGHTENAHGDGSGKGCYLCGCLAGPGDGPPVTLAEPIEVSSRQLLQLDDDGVVTTPGPFKGMKVHLPEMPFEYTPLVTASTPKTPDAVGATTVSVKRDPPAEESPSSAGADLTWQQYVIPCITDVLADHRLDHDGEFYNCYSAGAVEPHASCWDQYDWREHVAEILAARLEAVTLNAPEK